MEQLLEDDPGYIIHPLPVSKQQTAFSYYLQYERDNFAILLDKGRSMAVSLLENDQKFWEGIPDVEFDFLKRLFKTSKSVESLLVITNQRLVADVAKKFKGIRPFMELMQEGSVGLLEAVRRFDPATGNRLSTLAKPYIRGAILYSMRVKETDREFKEHSLSLPLRQDGEAGTVEDLVADEEADVALGVEFLETVEERTSMIKSGLDWLAQVYPTGASVLRLLYFPEDHVKRNKVKISEILKLTKQGVGSAEKEGMKKLQIWLTERGYLRDANIGG